MDPDSDMNPTMECKMAIISEQIDSFGLIYYDPDKDPDPYQIWVEEAKNTKP
jgi:hypothetical protein